jgi:hypothetical protein
MPPARHLCRRFKGSLPTTWADPTLFTKLRVLNLQVQLEMLEEFMSKHSRTA